LVFLLKNTEVFKISRVIAHEGRGTAFFWTFAPYIHYHLVELLKQEFPQENKNLDSIQIILDWVEKVQGAGEKRTGNPHEAAYKIYYFDYPILIKQLTKELFYLGYDQRGPSHLWTRILSQPIAENLYLENLKLKKEK